MAKKSTKVSAKKKQRIGKPSTIPQPCRVTAESLGLKPGWYNNPITPKTCESCRYCRKWKVPNCTNHQVREKGSCACRAMRSAYGGESKCGVCLKIPGDKIPVYFPQSGLRLPKLPDGIESVSSKPRVLREPPPAEEVAAEKAIDRIRKKRSKSEGYNYW